jgi:diguanylate cyclase
VIAEGVEKEDQLMFLRSLVCANVQGYFLSHPLTAEELSEVFNNTKRAELSPKTIVEKDSTS